MFILITSVCENVIDIRFFINFGISKQREDLSLFSAVCIIIQQDLRVLLTAQSCCLLSNDPNIETSHINNAVRKVY
jgi:hypothetical protein